MQYSNIYSILKRKKTNIHYALSSRRGLLLSSACKRFSQLTLSAVLCSVALAGCVVGGSSSSSHTDDRSYSIVVASNNNALKSAVIINSTPASTHTSATVFGSISSTAPAADQDANTSYVCITGKNLSEFKFAPTWKSTGKAEGDYFSSQEKSNHPDCKITDPADAPEAIEYEVTFTPTNNIQLSFSDSLDLGVGTDGMFKFTGTVPEAHFYLPSALKSGAAAPKIDSSASLTVSDANAVHLKEVNFQYTSGGRMHVYRYGSDNCDSPTDLPDNISPDPKNIKLQTCNAIWNANINSQEKLHFGEMSVTPLDDDGHNLSALASPMHIAFTRDFVMTTEGNSIYRRGVMSEDTTAAAWNSFSATDSAAVDGLSQINPGNAIDQLDLQRPLSQGLSFFTNQSKQTYSPLNSLSASVSFKNVHSSTDSSPLLPPLDFVSNSFYKVDSLFKSPIATYPAVSTVLSPANLPIDGPLPQWPVSINMYLFTKAVDSPKTADNSTPTYYLGLAANVVNNSSDTPIDTKISVPYSPDPLIPDNNTPVTMIANQPSVKASSTNPNEMVYPVSVFVHPLASAAAGTTNGAIYSSSLHLTLNADLKVTAKTLDPFKSVTEVDLSSTLPVVWKQHRYSEKQSDDYKGPNTHRAAELAVQKSFIWFDSQGDIKQFLPQVTGSGQPIIFKNNSGKIPALIQGHGTPIQFTCKEENADAESQQGLTCYVLYKTANTGGGIQKLILNSVTHQVTYDGAAETISLPFQFASIDADTDRLLVLTYGQPDPATGKAPLPGASPYAAYSATLGKDGLLALKKSTLPSTFLASDKVSGLYNI